MDFEFIVTAKSDRLNFRISPTPPKKKKDKKTRAGKGWKNFFYVFTLRTIAIGYKVLKRKWAK